MIKPSDLVHEVLEQGTRTALSARVLLKRMEEDIDAAKEAIREQAVREVTEQGKECQVDGATMYEQNKEFVTNEGEVIAPCGMKTGHDNITIKLR